ncbi:hypothetical protein PRIEUP_LOCUS805, partial [Pristimantis euphronides]
LPSHASGSGSQRRHGRHSGRSRSRRHGDRRRDGSRDRSRSGGLEKSRSYRAVSHSSSGSSRHSGAQIRETFVDDREVRSQASSQVVATVAAVEQSQPSVPTVVLQRSDPAMGVRTQPSGENLEQAWRVPMSLPFMTVWLVGHSYIHWAERQAGERPFGINLGFVNTVFKWLGVRGLRWVQVLPLVMAEVQKRGPPPAILVLHAGGNDIGLQKFDVLLSLIKMDIERLHIMFPHCVIVWSEIVARQYWRGARDMKALERTRRLLNIRVARFVRSLRGFGLRHEGLEGDNRNLLLRDGVHLNPIGMEIFLSDLQDGVQRA